MPKERKNGIEEVGAEADRRARAIGTCVKGMTKEELERELLNQYKVAEVYRAASNSLIIAVREQVANLKKAGVKKLPKVPKNISGTRDLHVTQNLVAIIGTIENSTVTAIKGLRKTADAYAQIAGILRDIYNTIFKRPDIFMDNDEYEIFKNEVCKAIGFDRGKEYNPEGEDFPGFVVKYLETVSRKGGHYKGRCLSLESFKETIQAKMKRDPRYEEAKKKVRRNARK